MFVPRKVKIRFWNIRILSLVSVALSGYEFGSRL